MNPIKVDINDLDKYFVKSELTPAIAFDVDTKTVLMLAYMNKESLKKTLETGYTWYWSRSRKEYWNKGATSGHLQKVVSIYADCDNDTLLLNVKQTGAACHTGSYSCFFNVKWPMSVIRINSEDKNALVDLADKILKAWRGYTDEEAFIYAETEGEPHNTITPIARMRNGRYELDLVLRNNITTEEYPLGVYHPHQELHHIKKENIGLIEVMGLAVLPSRLKGEMEKLAQVLVTEGTEGVRRDKLIEKHADWAEEISKKNNITAENVHEVLQKEIGIVFAKVLEHAGVYKRNKDGKAAFERFIDYVNNK